MTQKQSSRRFPTTFLLDTVWSDIRYAIRTLCKNPVFAATAVLTFALGIGATTAIFMVVHGVLLKPLAYHEPDRIVKVATGTIARFEEMKPATKSYTELGAYVDQAGTATVSGEGDPEVVRLAAVSANFLRILGVQPLLGRAFAPEEEAPGGPPAAMISARLWRRTFAGDPSIAGKTALVFGGRATIVGVIPDGFQFPFTDIDLWVTRPTLGMAPTTPGLTIFGRLRPGVDIEQASAELRVLSRQYAAAHPGMLDAKPNSTARVQPFMDGFVGRVRSMLWMLFGAAAFVLLIACANVASLLLARSHSRSREFAVRAAIGAGRGRILRQLLVESVLLACAGGALGIVAGSWSLRAITSMTAVNLPRLSDIRLDATVFGFATAISILTGVLFGLVPSLGASNPDLSTGLKSGTERSGSRGSRTRAALVAAQVALSIVLLIGATLLIESMVRVYRADMGFDTKNVLTMQMSLLPVRYDTNEKKITFANDLMGRIRSLPGVQSVGVAWTLPLMGWPGTPVQSADQSPAPLNERLIAVVNNTDAGYFQTLQIPLRRGRLFSESDDLNAAPVAIMNETLARRLWPDYPNGADPVGKQLLIGANPKPIQIVGIVGDIRLYPDTGERPSVYRPFHQSPVAVSLLVRAEGSFGRLAADIRDHVRELDRDQAVTALKTMEDLLEDFVGQRRLVMTLLEVFAGLALILTMVGTYGLIASTVTQRTREVGVRVALGARPGNIVRAIGGSAFRTTIIGIVIGLGAAWGLTRYLESYLFEVSPTDATTFLTVAIAFIVVASASVYLPLKRATRIDPMTVLRHE